MDKVKVRAFRPHEKAKLQRMKRQRTNATNALHARILLLSRGGLSNRDIAERVDCSANWVRSIIHRFNDEGLAGVTWYPFYQQRHGPRRFPLKVREQIVEIALASPKILIGMNQWSMPKLRDYLVQQGIVVSISVEWLRQLLRRYKVRLRRTKTWKESTDPNFLRKYRAIRRLYQKCPANGRRLSVDEFGPLNLQPRHGQCLARPGQRPVTRLRATYNRNGGVRHFLAFYDLETDRLYGRFTKAKTWVQFLSFLKWVRRRYPTTETLHIVLDNYGPHTKEEVMLWAFGHNIRLYFTPTSASWLNRIECHFAALKNFALETSDHRSHLQQQEAIESYLQWRNRRRLVAKMSWKQFRSQQRQAA
jgi:transposase